MISIKEFSLVVEDKIRAKYDNVMILPTIGAPQKLFVRIGKGESHMDCGYGYNEYLSSLAAGQSAELALEKSATRCLGTLTWISDIVGDTVVPSFQSSQFRIYPIIKSLKFAKEQSLVYSKLAPKLVTCYAIDAKETVMLISLEELKNWDKSEQDIKELAMRNFLRDKNIAPKEVIRGSSSFYIYNTNDGYDAARILLTNRVEETCNKLDKGIFGRKNRQCYFGLPNRDTLVLFSARDSAFRDSLIGEIRSEFKVSDYAITDEIYLYRKGLLAICLLTF